MIQNMKFEYGSAKGFVKIFIDIETKNPSDEEIKDVLRFLEKRTLTMEGYVYFVGFKK